MQGWENLSVQVYQDLESIPLNYWWGVPDSISPENRMTTAVHNNIKNSKWWENPLTEMFTSLCTDLKNPLWIIQHTGNTYSTNEQTEILDPPCTHVCQTDILYIWGYKERETWTNKATRYPVEWEKGRRLSCLNLEKKKIN